MDRSTDTGADAGRWLLYRIDDNGNEVAMRRFATREDAEAAMREYEARGHKQAYLVRKGSTLATVPCRGAAKSG